jgi:Glu-tRNA(Gln) amidotransferase subunit E-like FAD-binding protein
MAAVVGITTSLPLSALTMHVQTIHTEREAARMFEDTKALMKKITFRMDENGLPLA